MKTPLPLTFGALLAVLTLAACAGSPAPTASTPTGSASKTPNAIVTTPSDTDSPTPVADELPTCETIIPSSTVEALQNQGWTYEERELHVGDIAIDGGVECMWGDYSTASDHGQIYGWGPLDAERSHAAQTGLQTDGWLRSAEGDTVYFTEDPAYAIATDEDGYGMTYEFGDGWVKFADTKQGLLLIDWTK